MTPLEKIQIAIAIVSVVCGALSFALYLILSLKQAFAQDTARRAHDAADMMKAVAVTPGEVTELVKALAALGESLAKAGPALWSMIGAALFLLIAAISAGVLQGKPAPAPQPQGGGSAAAHVAAGGAAAGAGGAPQAPASK